MKMISLAMIIALSAGCNFKMMGSTEVGVMVTNLPPSLGGGISEELVPPGKFKLYPYYKDIYVIDTGVRSMSWAVQPTLDERTALNTRAADGNEVDLDVTLQYHVMPTRAREYLTEIGPDYNLAEEAVSSWARSHIRTALGELDTNEFYDNRRRYEQSSKAVALLNKDLEKFGIVIDAVIFDQHHFDPNYQALLNERQKTQQDAEREKNNMETQRAESKKRLEEANSKYNGLVAKAQGEASARKAKADAYFIAKKDEAEATLIEGTNEAEAIRLQIDALQKHGGENLVRLEFGKALLASPAEFIVIQSGVANNGSGQLNFLDQNELLDQMQLITTTTGEDPAEIPKQEGKE